MDYKYELTKTYYSTHYQHIMPQTREGWAWVLDRIELNFGDIFSSIPKDSLILDIACGVGYLEHYLLKKGFTNVYAVDLSEEQINVAKEKLKSFNIDWGGKVKFEIADAFEYLKRSDKFDVIVMIDFIEHFKKSDVLDLMHLAHGALKDGGFLFLRTPNAESPLFGRFYDDFTHETPFTRSSLRQILATVGFQIIRIDFEKIPYVRGGNYLLRRLKGGIRLIGLSILAKFLGLPLSAFSGDIIGIGKK